MNEDEFKKLLAAGEEVFGEDLWRRSIDSDDGDDSRVRAFIGQTNTWPCKLLTWGFFCSFYYSLFDIVYTHLHWRWLALPFCLIPFLMPTLPVIHVIEPISDNELADYFRAREQLKKISEKVEKNHG